MKTIEELSVPLKVVDDRAERYTGREVCDNCVHGQYAQLFEDLQAGLAYCTYNIQGYPRTPSHCALYAPKTK